MQKTFFTSASLLAAIGLAVSIREAVNQASDDPQQDRVVEVLAEIFTDQDD